MEQFVIDGGIPLQGEGTPAGNKNATLPMLAACLLTEEPVIYHNVPDILDVKAMRQLLLSLGVEIEPLSNHTWKVQAREVRPADLDPDLTRKIRASILLAGPMTARSGEVRLPPPGGDDAGRALNHGGPESARPARLRHLRGLPRRLPRFPVAQISRLRLRPAGGLHPGPAAG